MNKIGKPGMVGVGPGSNLQQKTLEGLQKDVQKVLDYIKKNAHPDEPSVQGFITHLKTLNGDVEKLKGAVPTLKPNYDQALSALHNAEAAFKPTKNDGKVNREILVTRTSLQKMVDATIA